MIKNFGRYIKRVFKHRYSVMKMCFKAGLVWQGIFHDISKYGVKELYLGVKYFDVEKDVYAVERERNSISMSFMHHISRNKHHPEYFTSLRI